MPALPILVVSCDRYADLWRPFFELFWRRWPDCRGPVHLGTNHLVFDDPRVQTIAVGDDVTWAAGVERMLDRLASEYVILLLEDFLLTHDVDNARIERLTAIAQAEGLGCLRLYSIYPPPRPVAAYPDLGAFAPGDDYRITAQAAIWKTAMLRKLLVRGFSAWDFEIVGSQLSDYLPDRVWGVREPALVYDHAVEKGRWRPQGLAICRDANVQPDLSQRSAFSVEELHRHENTPVPAFVFAERRAAAVRAFRRGERPAGFRELAWCVRRRPLSPDLWVIALAGLLGRRSVTLLHRLHISLKVFRANRLYQQKIRMKRLEAR